MPRLGEKPKHNELGTIANTAVLERQLGKLEYRAAKLKERLGDAGMEGAGASAVRSELAALDLQRPGLIKLLDAENERLAKANRARP